MACIKCGKPFRVSPYELDSTRRFCSTKCFRSYPGETIPEQNARLALVALNITYAQEHRIQGLRKPVDFYLPESRIVLEVDSPYWHQATAERDARKDKKLRSMGYDVIRIPASVFYEKELNDDMVAFLANALNGGEPA